MHSAKLHSVVLNHDERTALQRWTRGRRAVLATALRVRIILAVNSRAINTGAAARFRERWATLRNWRPRILRRHSLPGSGMNRALACHAPSRMRMSRPPFGRRLSQSQTAQRSGVRGRLQRSWA